METQTALPQILAHEVGRLKRVELPGGSSSDEIFLFVRNLPSIPETDAHRPNRVPLLVTDTLSPCTWLRSDGWHQSTPSVAAWPRAVRNAAGPR